MIHITLKKLISKKKVSDLISGLINNMGTRISICDPEDNVLLGYENKRTTSKYLIEVAGEIIGSVIGSGEKAVNIASLISYFVNSELEKKTLGREALEKYKEINLLYDVAERISRYLDLTEVSRLIVDETRLLIKGSESMSISLMLLNKKKAKLEVLSASGKEYHPKIFMKEGQGIAGNVFQSGKAEIVNDVLSDPRYINSANKVSSIMCAPLKVKDKVIGVINVSSERSMIYTAGELRLLITLASQAASAIDNALLHESKLEEERIKSHLERYVPTQVVQGIVDKSITLNPTKKNITILYSDIRNFTSICENLKPEKIVSYLNEYFTHMVEVIFDHGGTVDKFVGDAIMALFGAPTKLKDNEKSAIETAIKMQERLKTMPDQWIKYNLLTGIGINSGDVVVGNIGSPQHMDYTAIGDVVNTASRLQGLAKAKQILVSQTIYDATKDIFKFKEMGSLPMKGKKIAVEVFEVIY